MEYAVELGGLTFQVFVEYNEDYDTYTIYSVKLRGFKKEMITFFRDYDLVSLIEEKLDINDIRKYYKELCKEEQRNN